MPDDFVSCYLEHTASYESPTSFWRWSGYAAIASVLRDNCYQKQGDITLYPSLFILFLARSSYDRKNFPVVLCEQLVTKVKNTKTISGRASVQGIIDELSTSETDKKTGKIIKNGAATLFAPELGAAIVEDPAAVRVLTDIYDFKPTGYKNILRTQPRLRLDKIVLSMLAASNDDMIRDLFNSIAIFGGLLARTMLVVPNEFRPSNSLLNMPDKRNSLECLYKQLLKISELGGEFILTPSAVTRYEDWYKPFRESYKNKSEKSGILGRIHTHVLKLAMILATNRLSLTVTEKDILDAIHECVVLLPNYKSFTMMKGKSTISEAGEIIILALLHAPNYKLDQSVLLANNFAHFDIELFEKVMTTFQAARLVQRFVEGNEISFQLTQVGLDHFTTNVETQNEKAKGSTI